MICHRILTRQGGFLGSFGVVESIRTFKFERLMALLMSLVKALETYGIVSVGRDSLGSVLFSFSV